MSFFDVAMSELPPAYLLSDVLVLCSLLLLLRVVDVALLTFSVGLVLG